MLAIVLLAALACLTSFVGGMLVIKGRDRRSFITESHNYGGYRTSNGDVGIVLWVDSETQKDLETYADSHLVSSGGISVPRIRAGQFDLILVSDKKSFDYWKEATERLDRGKEPRALAEPPGKEAPKREEVIDRDREREDGSVEHYSDSFLPIPPVAPMPPMPPMPPEPSMFRRLVKLHASRPRIKTRIDVSKKSKGRKSPAPIITVPIAERDSDEEPIKVRRR